MSKINLEVGLKSIVLVLELKILLIVDGILGMLLPQKHMPSHTSAVQFFNKCLDSIMPNDCYAVFIITYCVSQKTIMGYLFAVKTTSV